MKSKIRINCTIALISSIISFFLLIFILFRINTDLPEALNIYKAAFDTLDYLMAAGHLIILIFIVYSIIFIFSHFRHFNELRILKILLLVLGIISLFAIGIEKVMADEIAREYRYGMDTSEVTILNLAYIIDLVFSILMFYFTLRTFPLLKNHDSHKDTSEEIIFTVAQYMGIVSGITGLFLVFSLAGKQISDNRLIFYLPFFVLFLIPYALSVLYWLSLKLKQKISDWYDEKQLQDIMKASLTTILLSFPGLVVFLLLGIPSVFHFFLYYFFLVLILFSGCTLYYFKLRA